MFAGSTVFAGRTGLAGSIVFAGRTGLAGRAGSGGRAEVDGPALGVGLGSGWTYLTGPRWPAFRLRGRGIPCPLSAGWVPGAGGGGRCGAASMSLSRAAARERGGGVVAVAAAVPASPRWIAAERASTLSAAESMVVCMCRSADSLFGSGVAGGGK